MRKTISKRMIKRTWIMALALFVFSGAAFADAFTITTPTGLNPGDQFFVIFATSTATPATSTSIGTYDAFVTAAAAGITYDGGAPLWRVYGLTRTDNNIANFFTGSAPVYLLNGVSIGTSAATFATTGPTATPFLTIEEDGSTITPALTGVWVGQPFGNELGSFAPVFGFATVAGGAWYNFNTRLSTDSTTHLYGFAELTVPRVPEPSTLTLLLVGMGGLVGARLALRRHKAASPITE